MGARCGSARLQPAVFGCGIFGGCPDAVMGEQAIVLASLFREELLCRVGALKNVVAALIPGTIFGG
ncbi:hypothetical protein [Kineosporia sp. NBRC 101731]|uniref:hypothetical protein n=1 Tax=Kineosporia sp. NBRC 101731 TaxID=3032199 RepID=UPI0024A18E0C|nr:hypothetical protein [Kineosporia sp. NBRC 101731]GLY32610.1 hypothetical protein Kisp02_59750 [Kineosporia sp. NBRC 101731]